MRKTLYAFALLIVVAANQAIAQEACEGDFAPRASQVFSTKKRAISKQLEAALNEAVHNENRSAVVLDKNIEILGKLKTYTADDRGQITYLSFDGPSRLSDVVKSGKAGYHVRKINGQDEAHHAPGFGTAVGDFNVVADGRRYSPSDVDFRSLAKSLESHKVELHFDSGVVVRGTLIGSHINDQTKKLSVLSFKDCKVQQGDKVLFEPEWGTYDMAVGLGISNVSPEVLAEKSRLQVVLTGQEQSFKELEPVFKALVGNQKFELVVPEHVLPHLDEKTEAETDHAEKDVSYYPYHFTRAESEAAKYYRDLLAQFSNDLMKFQKEKVHQRLWFKNYFGEWFKFHSSPTSEKNRSFFANPQKAEELVEAVQKYGKPPFLYVTDKGDVVITNESFIRHLKNRGHHSISLFRGHSDFDIHFYHLLLAKDEMKARKELANWIIARGFAPLRAPADFKWWKNLAKKLEDPTQNTDQLLLEIAQSTTTSMLFTSLDTNYTDDHMNRAETSETLEMSLNLDTVPDSYLEKIMVGGDEDVEVVFPYLSLDDIHALRSSLSIQSATVVDPN